jgi:hypothetical protein
VRETSGGSFLRPMIFSGFLLLSVTKNENRGNRIFVFFGSRDWDAVLFFVVGQPCS